MVVVAEEGGTGVVHECLQVKKVLKSKEGVCRKGKSCLQYPDRCSKLKEKRNGRTDRGESRSANWIRTTKHGQEETDQRGEVRGVENYARLRPRRKDESGKSALAESSAQMTAIGGTLFPKRRVGLRR